MIVSVTMDFALDKSITYSGGLGILEGDKFYYMARASIPYTVLTLFYRHGYVQQKILRDSLVLEGETLKHEFLHMLHPEEDLRIRLNNEWVIVKPLAMELNSAKVVFFEAVCPTWARALVDRLYFGNDEYQIFLTHALLAKVAVEYAHSRIGWHNITHFDLQEAKGALGAYAVPKDRLRFITHTPGPWGHPKFSKEILTKEFHAWQWAGTFPDLNGWPDPVNLSEFAMKHAHSVFAVSKHHADITRKLFPDYAHKIKHATNGIDLYRWQDPEIALALMENRFHDFIKIRQSLHNQLCEQLGIPSDQGPIFLWARRLTRYKRPSFVIRLLNEEPNIPAFFVLGGRPHPQDHEGIEYARDFFHLARQNPQVRFVPNFNLESAGTLMKQVDVLLNTPFPGWEACGTSYMKSSVNGVPVISSRDGGTVEFIEDGTHGWFFGHSNQGLIDIYNDPIAETLNEQDYHDFKSTIYRVITLYQEKREEFYRVAYQAAQKFSREADIGNTLRVLYPEFFKNHER